MRCVALTPTLMMKLLIKQIAIPLMKLLTNRLGGKAAKSLVISPPAVKSLVIPCEGRNPVITIVGHRLSPV